MPSLEFDASPTDPTGPSTVTIHCPRGRSSMVEPQPSKLMMGVRSSSPALPESGITPLTWSCSCNSEL